MTFYHANGHLSYDCENRIWLSIRVSKMEFSSVCMWGWNIIYLFGIIFINIEQSIKFYIFHQLELIFHDWLQESNVWHKHLLSFHLLSVKHCLVSLFSLFTKETVFYEIRMGQTKHRVWSNWKWMTNNQGSPYLNDCR